MERTVPTTESEEVDLYQRTYYSLLRSSAEVKIRTLEEVHAGMNSSAAPARANHIRIWRLSSTRSCGCRLACQTQLVVLGQNAEVFDTAGFGSARSWEEVYASPGGGEASIMARKGVWRVSLPAARTSMMSSHCSPPTRSSGTSCTSGSKHRLHGGLHLTSSPVARLFPAG